MIRLASALALTCLAALPAVAQEWDCSKPDMLPQQGMNWCAAMDYKRADEALNALWPQVRKAMKEQDAELKAMSPDLAGADAALMKAQRAWIDYRDGQCESVGFQARGGSLEPLLVSGCKARMTQARVAELRALVEPN
ncbi:lysozyme inhibitor LprI family protein [Oricola sp.]|uniref:lysozyme inhibitor LprI family protein n=1 Tax=Oricola sp. TaxID=1979950 RepID=UPI0025DB1ACD|nr:lysozyme inhibitor LprI family protein [Oricola sp.]MCI5076311.1 lysozyme inhibitor LprI family protein [Oricola sp.]